MVNSLDSKWLRTGRAWAVAALLIPSAMAWTSFSAVARDNAAKSSPIVVLDKKALAAAKPIPGKYPAQMVVPGQKSFDGSFVETVLFDAADGLHAVKTWESGPGTLQTDGYPHDEYCLVLEGQLEITNSAGTKATFGPGDTFVIPKGWQGVWDMKTKFRKQYVVLTAAKPAQ